MTTETTTETTTTMIDFDRAMTGLVRLSALAHATPVEVRFGHDADRGWTCIVEPRGGGDPLMIHAADSPGGALTAAMVDAMTLAQRVADHIADAARELATDGEVTP